METSRTETPAIGCIQCGSEHVSWRVKRQPAAGHRPSQRALQLDCHDCGANWEEPLGPDGQRPQGARPDDGGSRNPAAAPPVAC